MNLKETIETLKVAKAEVEWEYPMNYAEAFESAIAVLQEQAEELAYHGTCKEVWLVKNYCDELAYGEEYIRVFDTKDKAVAYLRKLVEDAYGLPWEDIPEEIGLTDMDTFEEDYVSIGYNNGPVEYWVVEKHAIE